MPRINDYIDNPIVFTRDLDKSLDLFIKNHQADKSAEWKERNDGQVVSGSTFSQCIRKAWYSFFTPPTEGEFNSVARKRMFLGHKSEEIILDAMREDPANVDVTIHYEQNSRPVNQVIELEGVKLSTTTDLVLEYPGGIFIPMEEKSTEVSDWSRQKPADWWSSFKGYDFHRRQICQWMYYAKANGLNVPFGVLAYFRRANLESKTFIFLDSEEVPFSPTGDSNIELYSSYRDATASRITELLESIKTKTIPKFPSDIPDWLCRDCQFREGCHSNK